MALGRQRKFILIPTGSSGDIYPFVWLGRGLASLGHEVVVVVHRPFDRTIEAAGLRTLRYGTDEDFEQIMRHPDLWHPRRGFELIALLAPRLYPEIVSRVKEEIAPGRTLLVGAGIAFGARIAAEAFEAPLVTVQLQPAVFLEPRGSPGAAGGNGERFRKAPRWLRRMLYRVGYFRTDRLGAGSINAYRSELGLHHPVRHIMRDYWMSSFKVLALFPEWYGPKQSDWPPQTVVTRFPLYDDRNQLPVSEDLAVFLDTGDAPVLFTPGSANLQARRFFDVGLEACRRLSFRALFVTRYPEQIPAALPPGIRHVAYVPFGQVLPRCKALVHHGGIGTVAQGLAAGVPQFVMAMSHDQPDNGYRLARLGVGVYVYPKAFTPGRVADALARLTSSPEVGAACRACRARIAEQMPT